MGNEKINTNITTWTFKCIYSNLDVERFNFKVSSANSAHIYLAAEISPKNWSLSASRLGKMTKHVFVTHDKSSQDVH